MFYLILVSCSAQSHTAEITIAFTILLSTLRSKYCLNGDIVRQKKPKHNGSSLGHLSIPFMSPQYLTFWIRATVKKAGDETQQISHALPGLPNEVLPNCLCCKYVCKLWSRKSFCGTCYLNNLISGKEKLLCSTFYRILISTLWNCCWFTYGKLIP